MHVWSPLNIWVLGFAVTFSYSDRKILIFFSFPNLLLILLYAIPFSFLLCLSLPFCLLLFLHYPLLSLFSTFFLGVLGKSPESVSFSVSLLFCVSVFLSLSVYLCLSLSFFSSLPFFKKWGLGMKIRENRLFYFSYFPFQPQTCRNVTIPHGPNRFLDINLSCALWNLDKIMLGYYLTFP